MEHQVSKSSEADFVSREHLVRLLVEQIERTFATGGLGQGLTHRSLDSARRGFVL